MSEYVYVPVEPLDPTTPANSVHNRCDVVQVGVGYHKGRGVYASAYLAETTLNSHGVLVTSGESVTLEPMKRLNRKRVDAVRASVARQLAGSEGPAWGLVLKVCASNRLAPKPA